jgi:DNA-binding transcriptional MerR regulator
MPHHFSIGQFGKLTGLTPRALRLYAREGLLSPEVVNAKTGYRYYAQSQAQVAERIRLLRSIDMSLEDIRTILSQQNPTTSQKLLLEHKKRIEKQLRSYQEALQALEELSARDINAYVISVKTAPLQNVIYMRQQTSLLQIETVRARAFGELYGFLRQENISPIGPGFSANARAGHFEPHQDLNLEADWLIDVCVPVAKMIENRYIQSRVFPKGKVAYVIHTGPYEPLFQVYQKITGWVAEQGLTHTGQTREIYHLSLAETKQRNNLKTEVQFYIR